MTARGNMATYHDLERKEGRKREVWGNMATDHDLERKKGRKWEVLFDIHVVQWNERTQAVKTV